MHEPVLEPSTNEEAEEVRKTYKFRLRPTKAQERQMFASRSGVSPCKKVGFEMFVDDAFNIAGILATLLK